MTQVLHLGIIYNVAHRQCSFDLVLVPKRLHTTELKKRSYKI